MWSTTRQLTKREEVVSRVVPGEMGRCANRAVVVQKEGGSWAGSGWVRWEEMSGPKADGEKDRGDQRDERGEPVEVIRHVGAAKDVGTRGRSVGRL